MANVTATAIAVGTLALGVVMFFKLTTPGVPWRAVDTDVVVAISAVVVVSLRWVMRHMMHRGVRP